jgi:opacity protein-like surface antigen
MKKLLAVVLLAVAMVAPVFAAEKGSMEIDGKLGVLFSPTIDGEISFMGRTMEQDADLKSTVSLGADFFYYVDPQIALGFGLEYVIPSEFDEDGAGSSKAGTTNLFVQAKYDIALNNDIFNNIYPIAQLGYGFVSVSGDMSGYLDVKNGLYWGIGLGTTIKENFLVELIYAFNYGEINLEGESVTADATLKLFKLKVGYKFSI